MRKTLSIILIFALFITVFIVLMISLVNEGNKGRIELEQKLNDYKEVYLSYEFEGKVIDFIKNDRTHWLKIKSPNNLTEIKPCCNLIKTINKDIFALKYSISLTSPSFKSIPLRIGGYVYKIKNSSIIFYIYKGKTYILSDTYCSDFSIISYYSLKEYKYPCSDSIKKRTNGEYWYIDVNNNVSKK